MPTGYEFYKSNGRPEGGLFNNNFSQSGAVRAEWAAAYRRTSSQPDNYTRQAYRLNVGGAAHGRHWVWAQEGIVVPVLAAYSTSVPRWFYDNSIGQFYIEISSVGLDSGVQYSHPNSVTITGSFYKDGE